MPEKEKPFDLREAIRGLSKPQLEGYIANAKAYLAQPDQPAAPAQSDLAPAAQPAAAPEAEDGERSRLLEEAERKLTEEARELGADNPMVAFHLWQSESQPAQPLESPESRRGDRLLKI